MPPSPKPPSPTPLRASTSNRRDLLERALGASALLGVGALASGCEAADPAPGPAPEAACSPEVWLARTPDGALDLAGSAMPYRQDDPRWGADLMWDRDLVIRADVELNGDTRANAESLLRAFDDGNDLANEGCMLTCLAMVLRLLAPPADPPWTPKTLNAAAQELYYYTLSGLSMTTLYADLVSEVSAGEVQLALKEEYLPGTAGWPRAHASTSALVRAYRSLPPKKRARLLVMLKTGTYDDTVASHYVLLHPEETDDLSNDDLLILDPAQPLDAPGPWRLSDSARVITADPDIAAGWAEGGIEPTQLGGVWVFARTRPGHDGPAIDPLVHAWAAQLLALRG